MNFKSDNGAPVHDKVMEAIFHANKDFAASYGNDGLSSCVEKKFKEIFERDLRVFFTSTGTAANSLSLAATVCAGQGVLCHPESHINTDEAGAPELLTGGVKLIPCEGGLGKMTVSSVEEKMKELLELAPHRVMPKVISLSQLTESGTVYSLEELEAFYALKRAYNLYLHMDGARFANALVTLGCSAAQATKDVDVLSFGGTKNGALCAEAIVVFNPALWEYFPYILKSRGQMLSKARFVAAQFLALLEDDLWLKLASHANDMAQRVAASLSSWGTVLYPVQGNEVFVSLSPSQVEYLQQQGVLFYPWGKAACRFVTSFYTKEEEVLKFENLLKKPLTEGGILY